MPTTLLPAHVAAVLAELAQHASATVLPRSGRGVVHVLYGGAHLYRPGSAAKLGALARASMTAFGKDDHAFARVIGLADDALAAEVARRVREKLEREPIEKTCIDFEDGYGPRPDAEEDADAERAAAALAREPRGVAPIVGIRIKALAPESARRAVRTLDLFVTTLARITNGALPEGFTVTLPKVSRAQEVKALVTLLSSLEERLGIAAPIGIELMVEAPRALLDAEGRVAVPGLVAAAGGRCRAVHLGAYDLTASLGVTAGEQRLDHPACEAARVLMQLALAGTGTDVVDGATTRLPTGKDEAAVHSAWALHAKGIRSALALGIHQGWDLHPAQLPARYGTVYAFFLADRAAMTARLRAFVEKATKATLSGQIFDDAATGQGLLEHFVRGAACGALSEEDVAATGLTLDEMRARSFAKIVEARAVYSGHGSTR